MIREYKAFISYRHLPLEMAIAKKLHKRIEHFKIPRKFADGKTRRLGYVFRDKDELPLSKNLTENVEEALDHSEFLIVICSPGTKESVWVLKEIAYFLKNHDHDHVLAVLADGSPDDSFPRQLVEDTNPDGTKEQYEPIAADLVANSDRERNRLFQTESLRILAALIGCTYDELYRREHRYRMMRMAYTFAGIMTIISVFAAMLLNRNAAITANYQEALRNQSEYLASESAKFNEDGDRLSAIYLALEALPSEDDKRPLVSAAEYALSSALGIYRAPTDYWGREAAGALVHTNIVEDFVVSKDEKILCSLSADNMVTAWDTYTMQKIWQYKPEDELLYSGLSSITDDGYIVVSTQNNVCCIKAETGEKQWEKSISAYTGNDEKICNVFISTGNADVYITGRRTILRLDHITGTELSEAEVAEPVAKTGDAVFSLHGSEFSEDGGLLAGTYYYGPGHKQEGIAVVKTESGEIVYQKEDLPETYSVCSGFEFLEDQYLFFSAADLSETSGYTLFSYSYLTDTPYKVYCVNLRTGEIVWETEHHACVAAANERLSLQKTEEGMLLFYCYANHLAVIDPKTGTVLAEPEFSSRIVSMDFVDDIMLCTLEDGWVGKVLCDNLKGWFSQRTFVKDIKKSRVFPSSYWALPEQSSSIIHYIPFSSDPSWRQYGYENPDNSKTINLWDDSYISDGCVAMLIDRTLFLSEGTPKDPIREIALPDDEDYTLRPRYSIAGLTENDLALQWANYYESGVAYVNIDTGELHSETWDNSNGYILEMKMAGDSGDSMWNAILLENETNENGTETHHIYAGWIDRELKIIEKTEIVSASETSIVYISDECEGCRCVAVPVINKAYTVDFQNKRIHQLEEPIMTAMHGIAENGYHEEILISRKGSIEALWTDENRITIFDKNGCGICTVTGETPRIVSAAVSPDGKQLLTVESDYVLRRYEAQTGVFLGKTNLMAADYFESHEINMEFTEHGFLIVTIKRVANLVSMEDWGLVSYIVGYMGYQEQRDVFCVSSNKNSETYVGEFQRRKLEDCIELGKAALNGYTWSEEQRIQYGLR